MKRMLSLLLCAALAAVLCAGGAFAAQVPAPLEGYCTQEEWEMLALTNRERLSQGLAPYSTFAALQGVAHVRETELAEKYSHTRPDGTQCFTALTQAGLGYTAAAENIASGQASAADVVAAWMDSESHRANILDPHLSHMGAGYADEGMLGTSWVQLFLNKGCSVSSISLSRAALSCPAGTSLDELELYVEAVCPFHGSCYLPLLSGMCSGYDSAAVGTQTVTVSYGGCAALLQVTVTPAALDTSSAESWAVNWLNEANEMGLLSQRNRDNFTADISRLQFADLSVRLAEALTGASITPAPASTFPDTDDVSVLKAKAAGIAGGYGDGSFQPDNPISRQEICVMLDHVISYVEAQTGAAAPLERPGAVDASFRDAGEVDSWALKSVALLTANDIMSGRGENTLAPLAHTSLQEAATLAVKVARCLG